MTIQQYFREVLIFSEKLVLPGFGSLKIEKSTAGVRAGKFSTSSSRLVFDQSETMEDEGIASGFAELEEISVEESRQRLLEFVDEIKFAIDRGDSFLIEGFCKFFKNEDGDVIVEKDPDFEIDFDSYGLESFELDEFAEEEEASETVPVEDTETPENHEDEEPEPEDEKEAAEDVTESPEEIPPVPPDDDPVPLENNRNPVWLITGIVVVVAVSLVLIGLKTDLFQKGMDFSDFFSEEELVIDDDFSDVEEEEFSFDDMVSELEGEIDSSTEMENALSMAEEDSEQLAPEAAANAEYHIIAGSFRDIENARELQKELTLEGYPCLIIEPGNGIYRVSAISFKDKPTALVRLIEFRDEANMPEAWLMNLE